MNVVAGLSLSTPHHLNTDGYRPLQAWAMLWRDVRSTSRRI